MSAHHTVERIAAVMNQLSADVTLAKSVMTERALVMLLAADTGLSEKTIREVLDAVQTMPRRMLTEHGRAIRIREAE